MNALIIAVIWIVTMWLITILILGARMIRELYKMGVYDNNDCTNDNLNYSTI